MKEKNTHVSGSDLNAIFLAAISPILWQLEPRLLFISISVFAFSVIIFFKKGRSLLIDIPVLGIWFLATVGILALRPSFFAFFIILVAFLVIIWTWDIEIRNQ